MPARRRVATHDASGPAHWLQWKRRKAISGTASYRPRNDPGGAGAGPEVRRGDDAVLARLDVRDHHGAAGARERGRGRAAARRAQDHRPGRRAAGAPDEAHAERPGPRR